MCCFQKMLYLCGVLLLGQGYRHCWKQETLEVYLGI